MMKLASATAVYGSEPTERDDVALGLAPEAGSSTCSPLSGQAGKQRGIRSSGKLIQNSLRLESLRFATIF
jgi:hypothetical protein